MAWAAYCCGALRREARQRHRSLSQYAPKPLKSGGQVKGRLIPTAPLPVVGTHSWPRMNFLIIRRTSLVVIFLVRIEQMAEMSLAEDNNMVKTLPSDRTDEPLRISVLPWRPWRDRSISYAVFWLKKKDDIAIDAISIANDVPWRLLPAVGFG